jgi:tetratricopeptide (TPR) repeat protein
MSSSGAEHISAKFRVRPEPAKALSAPAECRLLRDALQRNPDSPALRLRLAKLLNLLDCFDETVALLSSPGIDRLGAEELLTLARALLACRTDEGARAAAGMAERALRLASSDADLSIGLAEAAKASFRTGATGQAVAMLEKALELDPHNSLACKRLATHLLRAREPKAVLDLVARLNAKGASHSRLFASRILALAQLGQLKEARELLNLAGFVEEHLLPPPPGWKSIEAFNAAVVEELSSHPGLRFGRYGTASRKTWRIDSPATGAAPAARALVERISEAVQHHVAALGERAHPWLKARPERAVLASWCVITAADGFEDWHMHPDGWMTGVYYAEVPDAVCASEDDSGCLALGLPEGLIGETVAKRFGRRIVRPRPGLLALFPSPSYHRTFPHRSDGRRICISFDVKPG